VFIAVALYIQRLCLASCAAGAHADEFPVQRVGEADPLARGERMIIAGDHRQPVDLARR
jgi:hypothetical protein